MKTIKVPLDANLKESLEYFASEQGTSVERILNDLIRQYIARNYNLKSTSSRPNSKGVDYDHQPRTNPLDPTSSLTNGS
jgi:hypothetical protein